MTKSIPEDDLPQGPYEVFKCDDERWGWDVEDKDGQLIAQNCTEQFARAIAAIPEMRAQIGSLKAEIDWHCEEINRLCKEADHYLNSYQKACEREHCIRAEVDYNVSIRERLKLLEDSNRDLRAEKAELQINLAIARNLLSQISINPDGSVGETPTKAANETEA